MRAGLYPIILWITSAPEKANPFLAPDADAFTQTLLGFINYDAEKYPAELYDLIPWDHGGRPVMSYWKRNALTQILR